MSSVMMDNWILTKAFINNDDAAWATVLNAIVLWDEIWYYENQFTYGWLEQAKKIYGSVVEKKFYAVNHFNDFGEAVRFVKELFHKRTLHKFHIDNYQDRTEFYCMLSDFLGIDIFLHPDREKGFESYKTLFNRKMLFDRMDKHYREFVINNTEQNDNIVPLVSLPLLRRYISSISPSSEYEFFTALDLEQDSDLKALRHSLSNLEEILLKSDIRARKEVFDEIRDLTNKINSRYRPFIPANPVNYAFSISIRVLPSITLQYDVPVPHKHLLHTAFLEKVYRSGFEPIPNN